MTAARLVRATVVRAYDAGDATTVLGDDGRALRFDGDSAALARAVLAHLAVPRTRDELLAHLAELAGAPVEPPDVVDELLALLRAAGAVREAAPHAHHAHHTHGPAARRPRVVLGITGAIASVNAPALVGLLQRRGYDVRVAATETALRFVSAQALEALTHEPVRASLWGPPSAPVPHLDLAAWADAVLVFPASATTISRIARGDCSDLVAAVAISARVPVLVAPSMNEAMYAAPSVQRNLDALRSDGLVIVHPARGAEVADAPAARGGTYGAAPPVEDVAAVLASVLASRAPATTTTTTTTTATTAATAAAAPPARPPHAPPRPVAPVTAHDWDAVYAATPHEALPWHRDAVDPDVDAVLDAIDRARSGRPARFLDLGTGTGTTARAAARRGYVVLATDVSARALAIARAGDGADAVTWLRDDALESRLAATFDVVHDRGVLHLVPPERRVDYAATVARLTAPGGVLIVKSHHAREGAEHGTYPVDERALVALLGADFELERADASTLPGPRGAPSAVLFVLRRRGATTAGGA